MQQTTCTFSGTPTRSCANKRTQRHEPPSPPNPSPLCVAPHSVLPQDATRMERNNKCGRGWKGWHGVRDTTRRRFLVQTRDPTNASTTLSGRHFAPGRRPTAASRDVERVNAAAGRVIASAASIRAVRAKQARHLALTRLDAGHFSTASRPHAIVGIRPPQPTCSCTVTRPSAHFQEQVSCPACEELRCTAASVQSSFGHLQCHRVGPQSSRHIFDCCLCTLQ